MSNFDIILQIFNQTLIVYVGVFSGLLFIKSPLGKYKPLFNKITINFFTTILIIISFVKIQNFDNNDWLIPIIASILVSLLGVVVPIILARIQGREVPSGAELCTSSFPNALNFPFPIIYALAPQSLGAAGIFLGVQIILRNSLGLILSGVQLRRESIREIIKFPPIWGIMIGIILRFTVQSTILPFTELAPIDFIFQAGIFATLMTIGFSITKPDSKYKLSYFRVGMARYVVSGLFAILIISLLKLPTIMAIPILVQMIAPPAVYNAVYAEKFKIDTDLTSQVIVMLTLVALLILPLELYIINTIFY